MKEVEKVTLPSEIVNYIEGLAHKVGAHKDLLAFMLDHGYGESEAFKKYHDEYEQYYAEYEVAKQEMAETFVTPKYPNCRWNLNFSTGILEIEVTE